MKKSLLILLTGLISLVSQSQVAPTVTTAAVNNVQQLRAQGGGNVISQGSSAVVSRGVVWSTSPNPKVSPIYKSWRRGRPSSGIGSFTNTFIPTSPNFDNGSGIAPLLPNTTYYVRAFAINSTDTGYGQEVVFTTPAAGPNKKYYFSTSGNDNNDGLTPQTPKKTLIGLQNLVTGPNVTFLPGDSILFKRGDVFANGYDGLSGQYTFVSCGYIDRPFDDLTAPSGTPDKPIVFSNYGDPNLPLPNLIFPTASYRQYKGPRGWVLEFAGVSNIIVDGLQFNDFRFPYSDKSNPAFTHGGVLMGSYNNSKIVGNDTIWGTNRDNGNRTSSVFNFTLRNCNFSNMSFGIGSVSAFDSKITRNTFTNFKSTIDTFGVNDVLGGGIEALNGKRLEISYNYIRGAWAKSGRKSSTQGMGGIGMDVFNLQDSKIIYNTIVDCSGFLEAGSLDLIDTLSGMYNDTIAYNKIINSYHVLTLHTRCGDPFLAKQYNLRFWNNVCIENNFSRFSGINFGEDIYGDGQTFKNFWFWGNKYLTTGYNTVQGDVVSGSNVVTNIPFYSGIKVGGWLYGPEKANPPYFSGDAALAEREYGVIQSVTVSGTPPKATVTLDRPFIRSGTGITITIFPPLSEKGTTWSQPNNPSSQGYYGSFDNNLSNTRVFVNGSSSSSTPNNRTYSTARVNQTSSTTTINVESSSSLRVGMVLKILLGNGELAANTTILSIPNSTSIIVNSAPITPLEIGTFIGPDYTTNLLTITSTSGFCVNTLASVTAGKGSFPPNTKVVRIRNSSQVELSNPPSSPISPILTTLTQSTTTSTVTVTNTSEFRVGMSIKIFFGTGSFATTPTISQILNSTQMVLSAAPKAVDGPLQVGTVIGVDANIQFNNRPSSVVYGNQFDTLLDIRNNIVIGTTGIQMLYDDSRFLSDNNTPRVIRNNNLFYIDGGFSFTFPPNTGRSYNSVTALGGQLKPTEIILSGSSKIFKDQTSPNPELWDYHLLDTSWAATNGISTPGIDRDYGGQQYTGNASVGLYKFSPKPQLTLVSTTNPTCKTGTNGSITVSGGGGIAPYQYKIGTKPFGSATTFGSLAAGTYSITIKDSKGNLNTLNVTLRSNSTPCP